MLSFKWIGAAVASCAFAVMVSGCAGSNSAEAEIQQNQTAQSQTSQNQTSQNQAAPAPVADKKSSSNQVKPNLNANKNINGGGMCGQLSQADCLASSRCVVAKKDSGRGYLCRANINSCENGFIQDNAKKTCDTGKGCVFSPGSCFCPEGVQCICGGGHPPMCGISAIETEGDTLQ